MSSLKPDQANPKLRAIQMQPAVHQGQQGILLADPLGITERTLFVPRALAPLLPLMDGRRDLGTLRTGFELRTGIPLNSSVIENVVSELDASGFLDNARFAQAVKAATEEYRRARCRPPIMAGRSCPSDSQELAALLQGHLDQARSGRVQGEVPAGGLGVSPNSPLLPPRVGDRGLKTNLGAASVSARIGHSPSKTGYNRGPDGG